MVGALGLLVMCLQVIGVPGSFGRPGRSARARWVREGDNDGDELGQRCLRLGRGEVLSEEDEGEGVRVRSLQGLMW